MNPVVQMVVNRIIDFGLDHWLGQKPYRQREEAIDRQIQRLDAVRTAIPPPEHRPSPTIESNPRATGMSQLEAQGKGCVPCSADHFSTVSGALSEALRFARSEGLENDEVLGRIALSLDELNILERVDGRPEAVARLPEEERQLMREALVTSRELRHRLTDIKALEDLEETAAHAQQVAREFRRRLFRLSFGRLRPDVQERVRQKTRELLGDEERGKEGRDADGEHGEDQEAPLDGPHGPEEGG